MKQLKITLKRSPIGTKPVHRENLHGLGLSHPNQIRVLENTPAIRGMIKKVIHMVSVEEIENIEEIGEIGGIKEVNNG